jgi:hypothetical protein
MVSIGLPRQFNTTFIAVIGPKNAKFDPKSWGLRGILYVKSQCSGWRAGPEYDENTVSKSKSRSIPAAKAGRNDAD